MYTYLNICRHHTESEVKFIVQGYYELEVVCLTLRLKAYHKVVCLTLRLKAYHKVVCLTRLKAYYKVVCFL